MYLPNPAQMKAAEKAAVKRGTTYLELMERAGAAAAKTAAGIYSRMGGRVIILCGKGNNGGDGFAAARFLAAEDIPVTVVLLYAEVKDGPAAEEYRRLAECGNKARIIHAEDITPDLLAEHTVLLDAVFGTGFHGEPDVNTANIFDMANTADLVRVSIDIPSGLNAADGTASEHTIVCSETVTFGAPKIGMATKTGRFLCGKIVTADIGITEECFAEVPNVPVLLTDETAAEGVPRRHEQAHKGNFGKLLIIGGSDNMSGAAALNVKAALRSGAGIVSLASAPRVIDRVGAGLYECTFCELKTCDGVISAESIPKIAAALDKCTTAAIGSGLSVTEDTKRIVKYVVEYCGEKNIPLIIDADGLNCIAGSIDIIRKANCRAVLTPHIGELSRLFGVSTSEAAANRLEYAVRLAAETGAVAVAKGVPTLITDGKRTAASFTGNPGLSRGGSGDVLTGVISGLCCAASGEDCSLWTVVCSAVYCFGLAADIAAEKSSEQGMLPSDAADMLPYAFARIEAGSSEAGDKKR